jgi:co-chaperonin GroES (HSP10)
MTNVEHIETEDKPRKKVGRPKGSKNKNGKKANKAVASVSHETVSAPSTDNQTGIRPFQFKVLVLPDEVKNVTEGGIIIPDDPHEMEKRGQIIGTIVEVSPAAFSYHKWPEWVRMPKAGDRVYFARHSGSTVKGKDKVEYRMINDQDIAALIEF